MVWVNGDNVSFSFQKTYKDKQSGEYKHSTSYFAEDLAKLQILIQWANNRIIEKGLTEKKKENQGQPAGNYQQQNQADGYPPNYSREKEAPQQQGFEDSDIPF